ncbi:MAG: SCP2 sterol-binding domain-containing protein [Anaerolineae bacterium]|nr:SCP2 sterol-binding domain-containing protein [Anaerolineae bacterium]
MPSFTNVKDIFDNMCTQFQADKAQNDNATIQFDITGDSGGKWWAQVANGTCNIGAGEAPSAADMTLIASTEDYLAMINGELKPMDAFMKGKVRVKGNMTLAMKLQSWFAM